MGNRFRENPGIQRYPKNEREWANWINEVARWIAEQEDLGYWIGSPGTSVWRSDPSGVFPTGDPTADLTITFYDIDNVVLATRVLRGTLTSSTGNISVTDVSSSGKTTTYALYGDGTDSVRADISCAISSTSSIEGSLIWSSTDNSAAGATPENITSGGGGAGGGGGSK